MTSQKIVLDVMRAQGTADALDLRTRAPELDGTALIAEEAKVPQFNGSKDYSSWVSGAPVWEEIDGERQVFTLITPHNASHYPGSTPSNTPIVVDPTHQKTPSRQSRGWPLMAPADAMLWTSAPRKTAMCTETTMKTMNSVLSSTGEMDRFGHHRRCTTDRPSRIRRLVDWIGNLWPPSLRT